MLNTAAEKMRMDSKHHSRGEADSSSIHAPSGVVRNLNLLAILALFLSAACVAQERPGAALYRQLAAVGLDANKIYDVRDASFDREDLHFALHDGTIGFTQSVNGKVTGALFVGEGEILVVPPNSAERQSLALFTKTGVLNEHFSLAYFRFADDKFFETIRPYLRQAEEPEKFFQTSDSTAKTLAEGDALRLLVSLTHNVATRDRVEYLHARINGLKLGTFDVYLDEAQYEQISVGQASFTDHGRFYDLWVSFPMRSTRKEAQPFIEAIQPEKFTIKASVTPPTDVSGDCSAELKINRGGDRTVLFELSRYLKLSSVTLESSGHSEPLEFIQNEALEGTQLARRGNDLIAVLFPRPLKDGETLNLRFQYAGPVLSQAGGGLMYVGARGTWFPNRGPGMAMFDLEFKHPKEWKLLATGNLASQREEGGQSVSHWVTSLPVPVAGFNLGQYLTQDSEAKSANVKVSVYATRSAEDVLARRAGQTSTIASAIGSTRRNPGTMPLADSSIPDPAANAASIAKQAAATIDFWAPKIGSFPYSGLSLTQMPGSASQGWPGLVFLSSVTFLSPAERARVYRGDKSEINELIFSKLMTPHEVAHQWWGDAVFWRSYRDQWISEALANYSALMMLEQQNPGAFQKVMTFYRDDLLSKSALTNDQPMKNAGAVSMGLRLNSSKFPGAYDAIAYGRGTWLIHMLRYMVREDAVPKARRRPVSAPKPAVAESPKDPDATFFTALQNIQQQFKGKSLGVEDLLQEFQKDLPSSIHFEKKSSLEWFKESWIDGIFVPKLKLDKVKLKPTAGGMLASGLLLQEEAPDALVTSVPIYAELSNGSLVFAGRVFAEGKESDFDLKVPAGTKRLVVDPYHTVLRED